MRRKSERRLRAEQLRVEAGLSYSEIGACTGISESTLSGWLRDLALTPAQRTRLTAKLHANRASFGARTRAANRARYRQKREQAAQAGAQVVDQLPGHPAIDELALAMLYLGEGSKTARRLQLANMNPEILRYFLRALRRLYTIDERRLSFRLHLAEVARSREEAITGWWAEQLGYPASRFGRTQFDPRLSRTRATDSYRGVCTITYSDTYLQERLLGVAKAYLAIHKTPP